MKKLFLTAAMVAATVCATAQRQSDTLLLREIQRTNAELARVNKGLNTHAALVGVGGGLMIAGSLCTLQGNSKTELGDPSGKGLAKVGMWVTATGMAFVAASFIPLPERVKIDERGLVIDIDKPKKRKR